MISWKSRIEKWGTMLNREFNIISLRHLHKVKESEPHTMKTHRDQGLFSTWDIACDICIVRREVCPDEAGYSKLPC